jgi:hypothetical protein
MVLFQGLLFLTFGVGLLVLDYQSLVRGWLPCGSNGFKGRLEFRKAERPAAFWTLFGMYLIAGIALIILALRILAGSTAPLPLR